jgi:N-acetyl-anhydromuramyl-L-alanine amidase AmpD
MDKNTALETLRQLRSYTIDISRLYGISPAGSSKNNYGLYTDGQPTGAIMHYTASNLTESRGKVLLERFKPGGSQGVGIHFIVMDATPERHIDIKMRYPLILQAPEVYHFGHDIVFWQAGWFNSLSYGIEIRNVGAVTKDARGNLWWNNSKLRYFGRAPIQIGSGKKMWEPFTHSQMLGTLWVNRLMAAIYSIVPERFLGHVHVTSNREDPGLHFPIHEMREYSLNDVPLDDVPFLDEFSDDGIIHDDNHISEDALLKGLYRNDWDGRPAGVDADPVSAWSAEKVAPVKTALMVSHKVAWAKTQLRSVGYYVGADMTDNPTAPFVEALRIFQTRWKIRDRRGRWVQEIPITGVLDDTTIAKISVMVRQFE